MKKIGAIGICQIAGFGASLEAILPDWSVRTFSLTEVRDRNLQAETAEYLVSCDFVFSHWASSDWHEIGTEALRQRKANVIVLPMFAFRGFHPDMAYLDFDGRAHASPMGPYNSLIIAAGYRLGLEASHIEQLFNTLVYRRLGYQNEMGASWSLMRDNFAHDGFAEFMDWSSLENSCFMYTLNHPKQAALAQLARAAARRIGAAFVDEADRDVVDFLSYEFQWPVYPGIADKFGMGNFEFKQYGYPDDPSRKLTLREMIAGSLEHYRNYPPGLFDNDNVVQTAKVLESLTGVALAHRQSSVA